MGSGDRAGDPCPDHLRRQAFLRRRDGLRRRAQYAGLDRRCRVSRHAAGDQPALRRAGGEDRPRPQRRRSIWSRCSTARIISTPICRPAIRSRNTNSRSSARAKLVLDMPDGATRRVGITRLHLEQDAGKSLHDQHPSLTYVDLNRAGVALMEIVSEPDIRSAEEAGAYLRKLRVDPALSRHLRRQHGGRLAALRLQRLGAAAGRAVRHAHRDQERQFGALRHAGDRVRGAAPDRHSRRRRHGSCRRRGCTIPTAARRGRCAPRKTITITAISPIPICCRWSSMRPGSRK